MASDGPWRWEYRILSERRVRGSLKTKGHTLLKRRSDGPVGRAGRVAGAGSEAAAFIWAGSGCPAHTGSLLERLLLEQHREPETKASPDPARSPWHCSLPRGHSLPGSNYIAPQFQLSYPSRAGWSGYPLPPCPPCSQFSMRNAKNNHPALPPRPTFPRHHC